MVSNQNRSVLQNDLDLVLRWGHYMYFHTAKYKVIHLETKNVGHTHSIWGDRILERSDSEKVLGFMVNNPLNSNSLVYEESKKANAILVV